jgi:hypothetical protein
METWQGTCEDFVSLEESSAGTTQSPALRRLLECGDDGEGNVDANNGVIVLGRYLSLADKSQITLYQENIGLVFWEIVRELLRKGYQIRQGHLALLASDMVFITYSHEMFHHYCDVLRKITRAARDHLSEEALAVAWSWHELSRHSVCNQLSSTAMVDEFRRMRFAYSAPGYRDWINLQHHHAFKRALVDYLFEKSSSSKLESKGVQLSMLILNLMRDAAWCGDAVIVEISPHVQREVPDATTSLVLQEFDREKVFRTVNEVEEWLTKLGVAHYRFEDADTLSNVLVHVDGDVDLAGKGIEGHLPIEFGTVKGNFDCSNNAIVHPFGLPREVHGDVCLCENQISSLYTLDLERVDGRICLTGNPIQSGGIGLLSARGLKGIDFHHPAFDIIRRYLGNEPTMDHIRKCEAELRGNFRSFAEFFRYE